MFITSYHLPLSCKQCTSSHRPITCPYRANNASVHTVLSLALIVQTMHQFTPSYHLPLSCKQCTNSHRPITYPYRSNNAPVHTVLSLALIVQIMHQFTTPHSCCIRSLLILHSHLCLSSQNRFSFFLYKFLTHSYLLSTLAILLYHFYVLTV